MAGIRFSDPSTGRDVMPTLRCEMLRLTGGTRSPRWRQTGSRVLTVLHGTGRVCVGAETFPLAPSDIIAVPSWNAIAIEADTTLDVFSVSDAAVLEALGLDRRQICGDHD